MKTKGFLLVFFALLASSFGEDNVATGCARYVFVVVAHITYLSK